MRQLLIVLTIALILQAALGSVFVFTIGSQSLFNTRIKADKCLTTPADPESAPLFTLVYSLPLQNKHYYSTTTAAGTALNTAEKACVTQLATVDATNNSVAILDKVADVKALDKDSACAAKCGSRSCLCEKGMACAPEGGAGGSNTCVKNYLCPEGTAVCTPKVGSMTKINYEFEKIQDPVFRDQVRRALRVAISKTGIAAHCWDAVVTGSTLDADTYVYDIPLNNQGTKYQLVVLDNIVTKKGCAADEFVFPIANIPKFTTPDEFKLDPEQVRVQMLETTEFSFECLDDQNWIQCGQTCGVGCPNQALCTDNDDCAYGDCKNVRDEDGNQRENEKRCNDAQFASLSMIVVAVIATLFF